MPDAALNHDMAIIRRPLAISRLFPTPIDHDVELVNAVPHAADLRLIATMATYPCMKCAVECSNLTSDL